MRARRRALAGDVRAAAGAAAARHLVAAPEFARCRRVACYASLPDEIPSAPLIALAEQTGKGLLLPRMVLEREVLEFVGHASSDPLRAGRHGVREPAAGLAVDLDARDVVVVPGLAFDREGHRLGHGGGWYDRSLPPCGAPGAPCVVGFAYDAQIVDRVPHGAHDRRMDAVVTESGWIRVGSGERG